MSRLPYLVCAALLACAPAPAPGSQPASAPAAQAGPPRAISPTEASQLVASNQAILVDVREAGELKAGMAQPARWLATSKINADGKEWQDFVAGLPKDKEIVFYCAVGGRSAKAAQKVNALGFRTANMGGYDDWVRAGLPTRTP